MRSNFDLPISRCKAGGVVQQVDKDLFDLHFIEKECLGGMLHAHTHLDVFRFQDRSELMHGLADTGFNVPRFAL